MKAASVWKDSFGEVMRDDREEEEKEGWGVYSSAWMELGKETIFVEAEVEGIEPEQVEPQFKLSPVSVSREREYEGGKREPEPEPEPEPNAEKLAEKK